MQDLVAISAKKAAHIENYEILHTIGEGHFAIGKLDSDHGSGSHQGHSQDKSELLQPPGTVLRG